jgi:hypothetical protein
MNCPKCGSSKITEVPNNTLDVAVKCDDCGHENFIKKFEEKKSGNLFLIVTKEWYDKIASGEKRVEYRKLNDYWRNRLMTKGYISYEYTFLPDFKKYETVEIQCGYSKKYPRLKFSIQTIKTIKTPDEVKNTVNTGFCFAIYFKEELKDNEII